MSKWIVAGCFVIAGFVSFFTYQNSEPETNRTISSKAEDFSAIKEEADAIKAVNREIVSISHKDQINSKIDDIQKLAMAHPEWQVIKLYAALTKPFKKLEGILWRLRPVVESCGVCHVSAVSAIRKGYYQKYMTGPHLGAALDYVVEPTLAFKQFETIREVQDYAVNVIAPELEGDSGALFKLQEVIAASEPGFFMEFDAYLGSGYSEGKRFISDKKRFSIVTRGNLHGLETSLQGGLAAIHFFRNYDLDDSVSLVNSIVKKTALNNAFGRLPKDVTPIETLKILGKRKYRDFGKSRNEDGYNSETIQVNLDKAFDYYRASVDSRLKNLEGSMAQVDEKNDSDYLVSSKILKLNYDGNVSKLKEKARILDNAQAGKPTIVTSPKTGKQFKINPKAIFTYHSDIKSFLPEKSFKSKSRELNRKLKNTKGVSQDFKSWDYEYGMPNAWKDATFAGLLPEATNANLYEILRSLRLTPATEALAGLIPAP
jgi:hypothetical protein